MRTGITPPPNHQNRTLEVSVYKIRPYFARLLASYEGQESKKCPTSLKLRRAQCKNNCAIQSSARETGHISTPRLHALRHFHLEPINVIISHESHNDS